MTLRDHIYAYMKRYNLSDTNMKGIMGMVEHIYPVDFDVEIAQYAPDTVYLTTTAELFAVDWLKGNDPESPALPMLTERLKCQQ